MEKSGLAVLVFLLLLLAGSASAQWLSVPRPGADFQSITVNGGTISAVGSGTRMCTSTDMGETWTRPFVNSTQFGAVPLNLTLTRISILPPLGLIGGNGGLIMRYGEDMLPGDSRTTVHVGEDDILGFAASSSGTSRILFAGGFGGGVRKSTDSGATWTATNAGLTNVNVSGLVSGVNLPDSSGQEIFAGTYGGGVYVSVDNGQTWSTRNNGLELPLVNSLDRVGTTLFACGSGGKVFRSTDEGENWQAVGQGLPFTDILSTCVAEGPGETWILCGTIDQGVWRCPASGGNWTQASVGLESLRINSLAVLNDTVFAATQLGIFRSSDLGQTWSHVTRVLMSALTDMDALVKDSPDSPDVLVIGCSNQYMGGYSGFGAVYATETGGRQWNTSPQRIQGGIVRTRHGGKVIFAHGKGNADRAAGLYISEDYGKTWEARINQGTWYGMFRDMEVIERHDSGFVECLVGMSAGPVVGASASSDTGRTWRAVGDKKTFAVGSIGRCWVIRDASGTLRSSNGGLNWEDISAGLNGKVISFFSHGEDRLYAGIALDTVPANTGGVLASTDAGTSWFSAGLEGKAVSSLIAEGEKLLAVADGRVYAADRNRLEWVDVSGNLAASPARVVTATPSQCYIRAADGQSIWSRPMDEIAAALVLPPPAPVLFSPANGVTSQPVCLALRWKPALDASWYRLQLDTDSLFAGEIVADSVTVHDTLLVVSGLRYGYTYFWRVQGSSGIGTGPWSPVWRFSTLDVDPAVPRAVAPQHGASLPDTVVMLAWTRPAGATSFHLQLGQDSTFTTGMLYQDYPTPDTAVAVHGLNFQNSYWWRVNAFATSSGLSAFSAPRQFSIGLPPPGVVVLQSPAMNESVGRDTVLFRWRSVGTAADRYWLEYGVDSAFTMKAVDSVHADTASAVHNLVKGMEYYWRVRAHNASGWGPYSQVRRFIRTLTTVYGIPLEIPGEVILHQNFPNPFNPVTTIVFGLPSRMYVRIRVYNGLGEEVLTLLDEERGAGYHTVRCDAAALPSGIYFYRMQAGNTVMVRRFALIK
jgi:photosystem II stability/assembly factor-like uncharacterized protein